MAETNPNGGVPDTSSSTAPADGVSDASKSTETTEASDPMATNPETPTEAQQVQAGLGVDKPSDEARAIVKEDADWRAANPNVARIREANPEVGGESFDYLDHVSG